MQKISNKGKAALAIVGAGLAGGLAYLFTRAKAVPPEGEKAALKIQVYDSEGNLVPPNSPVTLDEGATYTVRVTVTNKTTRGGVAWEATLTVDVAAFITAVGYLIPPTITAEAFTANQTRSFNYSLYIGTGLGGFSGAIDAKIKDPANNLLASASEPLIVRSLAIVYGATVVIGV